MKKRQKEKVDLGTELNQTKEEWNEAYNQLHDACLKYNEIRERAAELILICEQLVNTIAHHPQSFDEKFEQAFVDEIEHIDPSIYVREERKTLITAGAVGAAGILAGAALFKKCKMLSRRLALLPSPLLGTVRAVFPHTALQTVFGIHYQTFFVSLGGFT